MRQYKYFAFISYNTHDTEWGKRLQRKLEHYRMPATLCSEHGWERTPIKPVFFAPTDIQPGGLTAEIQERLTASRHLIVICSPHSARSEWVGKEIEFFHRLGRTQHIHFFIVDGKPHSGNPETECLNPIVESLGLPEILGANIHERIYHLPWLNRERACVQLISKLLGVEYDAIWQRHRRILVQKTLAWIAGILAVVGAIVWTWKANQSFETRLWLTDASAPNPHLPPLSDAIVTLILDNESKTDTIRNSVSPGLFSNLPHEYIDKPVRMTVECNNFIKLDTMLRLDRSVTIGLHRDPAIFGNIRVRLWNIRKERALPGIRVSVEEWTVTSDDEGYVHLAIPLEKQRQRYHITSATPLIDGTITMPCGPDDVIVVEE